MSIRLMVLMAGCAAALLADGSKISKDLVAAHSASTTQVIMQYKQSPSQADLSQLGTPGNRATSLLSSSMSTLTVAFPRPALTAPALASAAWGCAVGRGISAAWGNSAAWGSWAAWGSSGVWGSAAAWDVPL